MGVRRVPPVVLLFLTAAILIINPDTAEARKRKIQGLGVGGIGCKVSAEDSGDCDSEEGLEDTGHSENHDSHKGLGDKKNSKNQNSHKGFGDKKNSKNHDSHKGLGDKKNSKNHDSHKKGDRGIDPSADKNKDDIMEKEGDQRILARRFDDAPVVCFIRNEAFGRPGTQRFPTYSVPVNKCTHVVYSYLETRNGNAEFKYRKIGHKGEKRLLENLAKLKEKNSKLKVMFSFGNGHHVRHLLDRIGSERDRERLAKEIGHTIRRFNLDGVNFHLEGPGPSVCDKNDVLKILSFIKAVRSEFGRKNWYITFQLPACENPKCNVMPRDALARFLDYVFLMTFDYKLDDLSRTKLTSGLYYYEGDKKTSIESESCLSRWINAGVPKYKIVPGIATYGRSFTLENPSNHGVSAKLKRDHPLGYGANFTKTDGYMDYIETCRRVKYFNWPREWVKYAATPYIHYKDQWVSYDDRDSADVKAEWFRKHWLGGVFVWTLDADDYLGACVGELFPMVDSVHRKLQNYRPLTSQG